MRRQCSGRLAASILQDRWNFQETSREWLFIKMVFEPKLVEKSNGPGRELNHSVQIRCAQVEEKALVEFPFYPEEGLMYAARRTR